MSTYTHKKNNIRLIACEESWIEGEAIRQLQATSELPGIEIGVGLPDLHPGKGNPVGAAFFSTSMIYPYIVGNDIGCGVGLFQTGLSSRKFKLDKWLKKICNLNRQWDGDIHGWLEYSGLESTPFDPAHGTIGSGNHFAELQRVETVFSTREFQSLGLEKKSLQLLVHSGSRGVGEALLRKHTYTHGVKGLEANTTMARNYIEGHDYALRWAKSNRRLIAKRFSAQLKSDINPILDIYHNCLESKVVNNVVGWLHRKGAACSDRGPLVIPGSRGTLSYLVVPKGIQEDNLYSLAHGAGRKWNRKSCRERLRAHANVRSLERTPMGNAVICDDKKLLYEEAPQAYKNIDRIIKELEKAELIEVIATLSPIITYKRRDGNGTIITGEFRARP